MIKTLLTATVLVVVAASSPASAAIVGVQAEDGVAGVVNGETFNFIADVDALGGQYATVSGANSAGAGSLSLSVNLPADAYDVWVKVLAPSVSEDSLFAPQDETGLTSGVNGFDPPTAQVNNLTNDVSGDSGITAGQYTWMLIDTNDVSGDSGDYTVDVGGPFTFVIHGREAGLRIDAIAFVSESEGFGGQNEGGDTIATTSEAAALDAAFAQVVPAPAALPAGFALIAMLAARRRSRPGNGR